MGLIEYIKDTRGELRHVAWPTQTQTVVYTVLVAIVSIIVALYLGLFDYIFTTTLARFVGVAPIETAPITEVLPATSTVEGNFELPTTTQ